MRATIGNLTKKGVASDLGVTETPKPSETKPSETPKSSDKKDEVKPSETKPLKLQNLR